ncbi:MAG: peroxiredoxin [Nitrososphaerales archaeon]
MVKKGETAPNFSLESHDGRVVKLQDFLGKKNTVIYFYIKDNTPGCTRETCGFRDMYEQLKQHGFEVFGISPDNIESHQKFAKQHYVPFPLLSDKGKQVAKAYGALGMMGLMNKRITFVIGIDGRIKKIVEALGAGKHLDEVAKTIE